MLRFPSVTPSVCFEIGEAEELRYRERAQDAEAHALVHEAEHLGTAFVAQMSDHGLELRFLRLGVASRAPLRAGQPMVLSTYPP